MLTRSLIVIVSLLAISDVAMARDDALFLPLQEALNAPAAKEQLNQGVKFYFGEKAPGYTDAKGSFVANRKTNAFNKSDEEACRWVFLSALIALRDRALSEGGNAVVNIHSFYKKNEYMSDSDYECHAGAIMAGVALKGTVVTLK
ncbi:excinuclease ATPase subunit [Pseudomaricurvus sp.]|uniref:excinuclease ATPase subunit n=1 Tax=Pseudomaricurvus sp. TaxID=2004510 RepID=UPI003F6BA20E